MRMYRRGEGTIIATVNLIRHLESLAQLVFFTGLFHKIVEPANLFLFLLWTLAIDTMNLRGGIERNTIE
jgi:hypothetical protein